VKRERDFLDLGQAEVIVHRSARHLFGYDDVEEFEPAVIAGAKRLLADPKLEIIIAETLGLAAWFFVIE